MKKDIKATTLEKINKDNLKPRPKSYFQLIKVLIYGALVLLFLIAVYTFNLMFYLPGRNQRFLSYPGLLNRLEFFPWPLLIIGSAFIGLIIYLYRHYEGGYKRHLGVVALILIGMLMFLGASLSASRFNERLERGPGFKRFYQWNDDNFVPRGPRHQMRFENSNYPPK